MLVRLLVIALLTELSAGCSDDDRARRAGDAATDGAVDAEFEPTDAQVNDSSGPVADAGSDGGDASYDGGACLEESYIWDFVQCFGDSPGRTARRVTLAELCADHPCPPDWNEALAAAAAACDDGEDAGGGPCWMASTECDAGVLRGSEGPNGRLLHYDPTTGELLGAALQLTDIAEECVVSELIAGERPPTCCEVPDAGGP